MERGKHLVKGEVARFALIVRKEVLELPEHLGHGRIDKLGQEGRLCGVGGSE